MNASAPAPAFSASRRQFLGLGLVAGASAGLGGCSKIIQNLTAPATPAALDWPAGDVAPEVRFLNRIGFGQAPGDLTRLAALGFDRYLDEQLNPTGDEPLMLTLRMQSVDIFSQDPIDLEDLPEREVLRQLQQAAFLQAVYSPHQLRERLVDFWTNHFNIYGPKGYSTYFIPTDQLQVIRANALGKFPDLLRASAHSPAMLNYLDNKTNRRGVANENYARELMELHTLGVHGGYTQRDVQEVARCFTGWTIENRFLHRKGTFRFDPARHDDGVKHVLGTVIPAGGGENDAGLVLDLLANHPSTAHFISTKLCRFFLGSEDPNWIARLTTTYGATGGDIKAMLRPLLLSPDLTAAPPVIKRPFDHIVSSLRALNADTDGGAGVQEHLVKMGEPLHGWPMPDGYPDKTTAWTGSLLARWNFASALAGGAIRGTGVDLKGMIEAAVAGANGPSGVEGRADALLRLLLSVSPDSASVSALRTAILADAPAGRDIPSHRDTWMAGLVLSSPHFCWR